MPPTPTPAQLAAALDDAGDLTITRITHLSGRQALFQVNWQGQTLEFQASISAVLGGALPEHPKHRREAASVEGSPYEQALTEDDVRQRGYPLYWSEEWLRAQTERLGSLTAISREYGYPLTTLSGAARKFKLLDAKPNRDEIKAAVQADWLAGKNNKSKLAKEYAVSIGSIFNWVKNLPTAPQAEGEEQG